MSQSFSSYLLNTSDILPTLITTFKVYFWKTELLETLFDNDKNSTNYVRFSSKGQYKIVSIPKMQR